MSELYMYLNYESQRAEKKVLYELLEELTHRIIASEQSIRRITAQLDELQPKGGANND